MQKQWLLEESTLWDIMLALNTEMNRQQADGMDGSRLHFRKLEELQDTIKAIINNVDWEHDEETDERRRATERVMISLIPHSGEWWSDPYTVVPVAGQATGKARWAVVEKGAVRPVGEKTYSQRTHAYRAARRLNEAACQAFTDKRGWFPTPALATEAESSLV